MHELFGAYLNQDYDIWGETIPEIVACYMGDSPPEFHAELIKEIEKFMGDHPEDLKDAFDTSYGAGFDPELWGYKVDEFLLELTRLLRG